MPALLGLNPEFPRVHASRQVSPQYTVGRRLSEIRRAVSAVTPFGVI